MSNDEFNIDETHSSIDYGDSQCSLWEYEKIWKEKCQNTASTPIFVQEKRKEIKYVELRPAECSTPTKKKLSGSALGSIRPAASWPEDAKKLELRVRPKKESKESHCTR